MSWLDRTALILTVIGGINWGLVGLAKLNLVELIFGYAPILVTIIYILVGVSACYTLYAYLAKQLKKIKIVLDYILLLIYGNVANHEGRLAQLVRAGRS